MPDPVNAADVVNDAPFGRDWDADSAPIIVAALLAYGDGDPVVIMPDGTLRRLAVVPGPAPVAYHYLTDPVQP